MKTFFTPGPAQLFPTYTQHLQTALDEQIGSISHRSKQFRSIYQQTAENLRALLNIPKENMIFFTGSATEVWERMIQNCVAEESFHLVNGSFSKKFYDFSIELHKKAVKQEADFGKGFDLEAIVIPSAAELVCLTHNETSAGVMTDVNTMHQLRKQHADKLFVVDMVSSAPYPDLDYTLIDAAFFSVQKAFGMPAGLGVWIANPKCLTKAENLLAKGYVTGTYHSLPVLWKNALNFETPATPNVLAIYMLGKICEDFLHIGIEKIRQETDEKAEMIYDFIEKSETASIFVENKKHRSPTVIVANVTNAGDVLKKLAEQNLIVGSGYGSYKDSQLRIANFPATDAQTTENLLKILQTLLL
ncbi:MAG: aminotransferase class V-fold PLP-dependent enzyme [Verrucomicrobia bacterium]|nr:aminotransferase class V-fold PLP-dependent enzyme [Cytophagales bacterium]